MAYHLSLLDKCPVQKGETTTSALERVTALAQLAERLGFRRFWFAEHHGSPALASSAPEILIAHLLARTSRIRVGAGGIMLQHYAPYKVAETFNTLAALAPDRVDLGVGKSPGGFPMSTAALQLARDHARWPNFQEHVRELDACLDRRFERGAPPVAVAAPLPTVTPQRFLLGGSVDSAIMAAELGWHFVFAGQINGAPELIERSFDAFAKHGGKGKPILACLALVSDTKEKAESAVSSIRTLRLTFADGKSVNLMNRDQADEYVRQVGATSWDIKDTMPGILAGTQVHVHRELDALHRRFGIEEFMVETPIIAVADRQRSVELLGEANASWAKAG